MSSLPTGTPTSNQTTSLISDLVQKYMSSSPAKDVVYADVNMAKPTDSKAFNYLRKGAIGFGGSMLDIYNNYFSEGINGGMTEQQAREYATKSLPERFKRMAALSDPATEAAYQAIINQERTSGLLPGALEAAQDIVASSEELPYMVAEQAPNIAAVALGSTLGRLATTALGTLGKTIGGMVGGGAGSAITEAGSTILDEMMSLGADPANPQQMATLLQDPEFMGYVKEQAARKGITVGVFDAVSMGLAGRFLGKLPAEAGILDKVIAATKEGAQGATFDMGGELTSQKLSGDREANVGDVVLEGALGLPQTAVDVAMSPTYKARAKPKELEGETLDKIAPTQEVEKAPSDIEEILMKQPQSRVSPTPTTVDEATGETVPAPTLPTNRMETEAQRAPMRAFKKEQAQEVEAQRPSFPAEIPATMLTGTLEQRINRSKNKVSDKQIRELHKKYFGDSVPTTYEATNAKGEPVTKNKTKVDLIHDVLTKGMKIAPQTEKGTLPTPPFTAGGVPTSAPVGVEMMTPQAPTVTVKQPVTSVAAKPTTAEYTSPTTPTAPSVTMTKPVKAKRPQKFYDGVYNTLQKQSQATTGSAKVAPHPMQKTDPVKWADIQKKYNEGVINSPEDVKTLLEPMTQANPVVTTPIGQQLQLPFEATPVDTRLVRSRDLVDAPIEQQKADILRKDPNVDKEWLRNAHAPDVALVSAYQDMSKVFDQEIAQDGEHILDKPEEQQKQIIADRIQRMIDEVNPRYERATQHYMDGLYDIELGDLTSDAVSKLPKSLLERTGYALARTFMPARMMGPQWLTNRVPELAPMLVMADVTASEKMNLQNVFRTQYDTLLKSKGRVRVGLAFDILNKAQKLGNDLIISDTDGLLYYKNDKGKLIAADKPLTETVLELNSFYRQGAKLFEGEIRNQLADPMYGLSNAKDITPKDLRTFIDEQSALGASADVLKGLEGLYSGLKSLSDLNSNPLRPYVPRFRNKGKWAVAFYAKKDKNLPPTKDNLELRHFESVGGTIDGYSFSKDDLTQALKNAERERTSTWGGEEFFTFDGKPMTGAQPFVMTKNNVTKQLKGIEQELIHSLLTRGGVSPKELEKTLEEFYSAKEDSRFGYRFAETKNYTGYEEDPDNVANSFIDSTAITLSKFRNDKKLTKAYDEARNAPGVLGNEYSSRVIEKEYLNLTTMADAAAWLRAFNAQWALLGRISSAVLQTAAIPINITQATAHIGFGNNGNPAKAMLEITKSLGTATRLSIPNTFNMLNDYSQKQELMDATGLSSGVVDSLYDLKSTGSLDALLAGDLSLSGGSKYQLQALPNTPFNRKYKTLARGKKAFADSAGALMTGFETFSRLGTALHLLKTLEDPKAFDKAVRYLKASSEFNRQFIRISLKDQPSKADVAQLMIKNMHGRYDNAFRPPFLRGLVGNIISPLSTFMFNQSTMLFYDTIRTPHGFRALIAVTIVTMLMSGMKGGQGYELFDLLWRMYKRASLGDARSFEDSVRLTLGELGIDNTTMRAITGGATNAAGIDIGTRITPGLPGIGAIIPYLLRLIGGKSSDALGLMGGLIDTAKDVTDALSQDKPILPAFKSMLHMAIQDWIKAHAISENRVMTSSGNKLVDLDEKSYNKTVLSFIQGAGFTPSDLAEARYDMYRKNLKPYADLRAQWVNGLHAASRDLRDATREGDVKKAQEALARMKAINEEKMQKFIAATKELGYPPFDPMKLEQSVQDRLLQEEYPNAAPKGMSEERRAAREREVERVLGTGAKLDASSKTAKELLLEERGYPQD